MEQGAFKNYTSTSVLAGVDVEQFTHWSHRYFKKVIQPHLSANKEEGVLEIGCGYGRYTGLITNDMGYKNTVGIDISEEQIQFAKDHFHLTNVFCVDAIQYLQQSPSQYKTIILMDVLEHLELSYAVTLLQLCYAQLKPGGKFIIQVPNGLSPMKPIFYGDVTHVRAFSVNSMSQILRMGGFSRFEHLALPPLVTGFKSFIHWLLWRIFVNPAIRIFVLLSHGNTAGGIYSSNLLTIASK